MCVVSLVGDHFSQKFTNGYPGLGGIGVAGQTTITWPPGPSSADFEALKKEVLEMKELLKRAKKYDEQTNQPNCEQEDKITLLRKVAAAVGIDLNEIFGPKP